MRVLRFAPIFVAIAPLWAASISVSTYCAPLVTQTDTGTSASCSGTAPDGLDGLGGNGISWAQAQAAAAFNLLPDGIAFAASVHAISGSTGELQPQYVDATASATITATIDTVGPPRPGFVVLSCGNLALPVFYFGCLADLDGGAGGGGVVVTGLGGRCTSYNSFPPCIDGEPNVLPTGLGEPIQFEATLQAYACGGAGCDSADGYGTVDLVATFYEADHTTPVAVYESGVPVAAPEPAALLMALGLLVFGLARKRCLLASGRLELDLRWQSEQANAQFDRVRNFPGLARSLPHGEGPRKG